MQHTYINSVLDNNRVHQLFEIQSLLANQSVFARLVSPSMEQNFS